MRLPIFLALLLTLACCTRSGSRGAAKEPAPSPERRLTLLFTSDLWGQLEPCGCSADMRGGLDRAASYVERTQEAGPTLFVDAGDALFDSLHYPADVEVQARLKAKAVAASLLSMGLQAKAAFERDRVDEQILATSFPEGVVLDGPALRREGEIPVGLIPFDASELSNEAASAELQRLISTSRREGAQLVVALLHAPRARAIQLGAGLDADLVVASHVDTLEEGDRERASLEGTPVFMPQARGQSLLQIEVVLREGGGPLQLAGNEGERDAEIESLGERIRTLEERISKLPKGSDPTAFQEKVAELRGRRRALSEAPIEPPATGSYLAWRFVPVTEDLPSNAKVKAILAGYDREVAQANLAFAQAEDKRCVEAAPGEASFVGTASCAGCHQAAHGVWQKTEHGDAYATLEAVNKQYDLSCISCHVTGWDEPGGPCRVDRVEGRKDVGCESCHGPGSLHVAAPLEARLQRQVPEATCKGCHTPEQSSAFDYASYLQRILGPGHGQPSGGG